jgi:RNA polymerase sigma-70 factor (ECF subfamily)
MYGGETMLPLIITQIEDESDRAFMSELYERYYKLMRDAVAVYRFGLDADDVINDACLKLMRKIPLLRGLSCCALRSYIVSTIRSVSIDYIRKRDGESAHSYLGTEDDAIYDIDKTADANELTPDQIAVDKESVTALMKAVERLSSPYKDILEFKYLLEMTNQEIGKLYGITPDSVRMYLTRARRMALTIFRKEGISGVGEQL